LGYKNIFINYPVKKGGAKHKKYIKIYIGIIKNRVKKENNTKNIKKVSKN
jgi:hypothetical protein